MKRLLLLTAIVLSGYAFGQQMPQFSQYLRNQYMVNPGAAGVYDFVDVTLGGRMQWVGFGEQPVTTYLYASSPLKRNKVRYNPSLRVSKGPVRNPEIKTGNLKHALGGMLLFDQYGAFQQFRGALTYALHIPVSQNYNLSFGANLGLSNRSFLQDRAKTLNMMDPAYSYYTDDTYDAFAQNSNGFTMDLGAGLYFYSNKLFLGFSAEQLTKDFVSFGAGGTYFDPLMHFQFTGGYKFSISDNLTLMPAVLLKYMKPAPMTFDGSLQLEYKEWLWFTLSYRQGFGGFNNADAIIAMLGANISERFKIGYSYDYSLSRFNQYSSGGHEVVLGLMLGR